MANTVPKVPAKPLVQDAQELTWLLVCFLYKTKHQAGVVKVKSRGVSAAETAQHQQLTNLKIPPHVIEQFVNKGILVANAEEDIDDDLADLTIEDVKFTDRGTVYVKSLLQVPGPRSIIRWVSGLEPVIPDEQQMDM